ncbi:molybdopterin molybdotransferase MoeA [Xanthobacter dioxanivorans]|uniref:Molybdopterin molybdenumtransferase n=1 Tax=Xanthobacter dioxanivorans TaxID=2528964 RepID=A0A974PLQ3_9HYPH|nr:gephyrin-like molybdotransferase Glp [Xanthobacter dioxanivorans]QRG05491.1 molybdopterin molybdotransferase MoeA [Xanthobacter dioxanivorans]
MALMSVEEAIGLVTAEVSALGTEDVPVAAAAGRVLARDLLARRTQPPADMSAMDGYAVRGADIAETPARLAVIGESAAGRPFAGPVGLGEAVRIFTGAVVPEGADTVVIQENTARDGAIVTTTAPTATLRNVRLKGCDFTAGTPGLVAGRRLTGRDIMLAAAMDHPTLPVARRPRVALMQTGDELVLPGQGTGKDSEIVVSNAFGLAALARRAGAEVTDLGLIGDDLAAIRARVAHALSGAFDLVVSSGGASVGDHDLMGPALRAEGVDLSVHKIALRPGKPLMFGSRGGVRVLGLPGNPVSSHVCAMVFLVPLVRALQGDAAPGPLAAPARLAVDVPANDARRDFMRARLERHADGSARVTPFASQDSAMLSVLAAADCLLIRPPFAPAGKAGDPCEIIPFDD